uniref:Uncharacterized protein n=1 Tax=Arundo donax TaxID=35708 RepID=A0A0A8Y9L9_ARUDO
MAPHLDLLDLFHLASAAPIRNCFSLLDRFLSRFVSSVLGWCGSSEGNALLLSYF